MSEAIECGFCEQSLNQMLENHVCLYKQRTVTLITFVPTQKSRLSALESLKSSNSRSVVVASDVAARGLDISQIATVVHYDVARTVDTFVHRAGRTAVSAAMIRSPRSQMSRERQ